MTFIRNWFLSSNTRFLPFSMTLSNLAVKRAMRFLRSSKPKFMFGSESAIDGASADDIGGDMVLVRSADSRAIVI